jgi:GDP-L-fucose synthase
MPTNTFGPNDNYHPLNSHFIPSLIRKIHQIKIKNKKTLQLWGNGKAMREFTYSADMAKAFLWNYKNYSSDKILNVGSTEENSIKKIAHLVADALKLDKNRILFDTNKPNGVFKKSTNNKNFIRISKFKFIPLKKSIKKQTSGMLQMLKITQNL